MPISNKILDKIKNLQAEQKEKDLMLEILNIEDKGSFRYNSDYENAIKEYIAAQGKDDKQ